MFSWFSSSKPANGDSAPPATAPPTVTAPTASAAPTAPTSPSAETQLERLRRQDQLQKLQQEDRERSSVLSARSLKQLGLFFAGAGFLFWSTAITRRAVARKQLAAAPKFYQPSTYNRPAPRKDGTKADPDADGGVIAVQALGLATLNVFSFAIMMTGGLAWAFDVSSVDDLRAMARKQLYGSGGGAKTDEELEKEVEELVAKILSRAKGKTGGKEEGAATGDENGR